MSATTDLPHGVHYGVPFAQYRDLPGLNISTLAWGLHSAEHLKAAMDGRIVKSSRAMGFGRAMHARLLEPDVYLAEYQISPGCQAILKTGDSKGAPCGNHAVWLYKGEWLCGSHIPKGLKQISVPEDNVISADEAQHIESIAEAVSRHKVIRLLRQRGGFEATVRCQMDGVEVKARMDKLIPFSDRVPSVVIDLKKVQVGGAGDEDVAKDIWNYHYDAKAAWYRDVVEIATGIKPEFIWIFIEDGPPYGINVIEADTETLSIGRIRYRECMGLYLAGIRTGEWPGYANRIKPGGLPEYIRKRYRA